MMNLGRLSIVLAAACVLAVPARAETVRAAGTGTGIAMVRLLAEAYGRDRPGTQVWVPGSVGTSGAVKGLAAGKLDIGIIARPLVEGEVEGAVSITLCRTPLVFFTNPGRRDVSLSRKDLPALFAATLPAFQDGEVRMLLRPANDISFVRLQEFFPELAPSVAAAREVRGANLAVSDQDSMDMVETSRSLVGFGALAPILAEKRKLVVVPLDGIQPGTETLESGGYSYGVDLILVLGRGASEAARAFIEFSRSEAGAGLMRANGCVPATAGGR